MDRRAFSGPFHTVIIGVLCLLALGTQGAPLEAGSEAHQCKTEFIAALEPKGDYMGVVISTDGKGGDSHMDIINPHPRTDDAKPLLEFIAKKSSKISKPTILYVCTHDHDVWDRFKDVEPKPETAQKIEAILEKCPMIFFLAWNPITYPGGKLGPRTIPIPDFEVRRSREKLEIPPVEKRTSLVLWRGVTTGIGETRQASSYGTSDRFKMVETLSAVPGTDVKFSRRVQDVSSAVVPDSLMGEEFDHHRMVQGKMVIDVDGNANAWEGLRWKLFSGAPVVKVNSSRGYIQWYYRKLVPGKHVELVDVQTGDLKGVVTALADKPEKLTAMGAAGKAFAEKYLKPDAAHRYLADVVVNVWDRAAYFKTLNWQVGGEKRAVKLANNVAASVNVATTATSASSYFIPMLVLLTIGFFVAKKARNQQRAAPAGASTFGRRK